MVTGWGVTKETRLDAHLVPEAELSAQAVVRVFGTAGWLYSWLCSHFKKVPTEIALQEVLSSVFSSNLAFSSWCL